MSYNNSVSNIKSFLLREYGIKINGEKLQIIIKELFDSNNSVKDKEKFNFLDNIFTMIFGIDFNTILTISKEETKTHNLHHDLQHDLQHDLIIQKLNLEIEKKDREIYLLKEVTEELRTNYWNLKHGI
jgi:hypothetical protein